MGLSSTNQHCIAQDKEGFIWIGTDDGLNRFDGHTFKVYRKNPGDSTSLQSNIINCLYVDSRGVLWIGTYAGGLSRYNKEKDNFYTYTTSVNDTNALLSNEITTITEDKYNRIWVGTVSPVLHQFNPEINGFRQYLITSSDQFHSTPSPNYSIDRIIPDDEILWIANNSGILTALNISNMTFQHFKLFDVLSNQTAVFSIVSLMPDNNLIWIGTWSKGIWIFDKNTGKCVPYLKEKNKYINFIFKDNKDQIWYSPESEGLVMIKGKQVVNYRYNDFDRYSLSSNSLSNYLQDQQGNLWFTSKQGDLNYFIVNNQFYSWYKSPNLIHGLSHNIVTAVIEDSKSRIWVGYQDGGLDILDGMNRKPKLYFKGDHSNGLGPGPIMYIYESKNGIIWIGKYLDGLKKYDESQKYFKTFRHIDSDPESIAGNDVRYISEDSKGNLWIATHGGGVDKFYPDKEKFIHHRSNPNSPSTTIYRDWTFSAVCDKNDNVWIGTVSGASVLSEKSILVKHYRYDLKDGYNLSDDIVKTIFFDSKGYVWFGTKFGLNKLNTISGAIKKYFMDDGLPSNVILDIHEDDNYNLWISTTKGLSKFSPEKESFQNYSILDGLETDDFNSFASYETKTGNMYFGGRTGLTRFHPDSIKINQFIPPVYITDLKLFNQSVPIKKNVKSENYHIPKQINYCEEIVLEYNQNVITFDFVALNYLNLKKNLYKYKLEGFDSKWSSPGYKREVTYTNLAPGEYSFKVIASNNDGVWNNKGASLKLIINPPFWRTNIAYTIYIILGIFLLYLFRKIILHEAEIKRMVEMEKHEILKLQEMDSLKMQFFSNVSHEFRTPITLIAGPVENIINTTKDELVKQQLSLVSRNTNRLLRLINQLMDFRKIEKNKLELSLSKSDIVCFIKNITDAFEQDLKQKNINFSYHSSHSSFILWFDSDKLEKIIYNLFSNALKYTPYGGQIIISIDLNGSNIIENTDISAKKMYLISMKDSGIGIPSEEQHKIFERFYQIKSTGISQGTGIGLSLVNELVKLHKGEIHLNSELNKGSEFTVVLPLWTDESELPPLSSIDKSVESELEEELISESENSAEQKGYSSDKSAKILIIEDNTDMRFYIKSQFKDSFDIIEAQDGLQGVKSALDIIPDAIICDIMMPGMDGFQVCKTLKNDQRTSHIPIVILTAKSSEENTIEGLESGADDYVTKPFSSAILQVKVKNLIESRILLRKKFVSEPFAAINEISPSKVDERLMNKAYSIVEKHLGEPDFDVSEFAREIGISRTQLYRKINAISGQSVKEFIRIIRLKKAVELLLINDKNISEIAYTVGFNSLSYFTTSFTEYFGINPSKYIDKYVK
ncbi:MAG: response regulator [Calditrichaceae bacterium]|nr:response regulator [Calditrichaceae bacterium]MBN2708126.1 response regulator [Calditrichaceae bacterium]